MSTDQARRDALHDELARHRLVGTSMWETYCSCGEWDDTVSNFNDHQADALMPLLADWAAEERQAGAEGVRTSVEEICDRVSASAHTLMDGGHSFGGTLTGLANMYAEGFNDVRAALTGDEGARGVEG